MPFQKCLGATVCAVIVAAASLLAQQADENLPARFTTSTELVIVPTVVTDKSGAHVSGLTKEDFTLEQDGKRVPISVFEEVKTDAQRFHRMTGENGQYSNYEIQSGKNHRLSIILLDLINTEFTDLARAREQLIKFLTEAADSGEPICLLTMTPGGIHLIQNFTEDPKVLADALRRLPQVHQASADQSLPTQSAPSGSDPLSQALNQMVAAMLQAAQHLDSLQRKNVAVETLNGLGQVAKAFGRLPGRKSLIWAGSGFSYSLSPPNLAMCEPACPVHRRDEVQAAYEKLWQLLNDAQIALYPIDLRALATDNLQASESSDAFTRPSQMGDRTFDRRALGKWAAADATDTMEIFADKTGGRFIRHGNDLMRDFREAVDDDSTYYVLGYYLDRKKAASGWHKLSVSVRRDGTQIRSRNGFLLNSRPSATEAHEETQLALLSPLDFTGIPVTIRWSGSAPSEEPGKSRVHFDLVMPPGFALVDEADQNHLMVDVTAVALDDKGKSAGGISQHIDAHLKPASYEQVRQHGMTFRSSLSLPPGKYTVRFAVRDALADRVGSVGAPLDIAAYTAGAQTPSQEK